MCFFAIYIIWEAFEEKNGPGDNYSQEYPQYNEKCTDNT